MALYQWALGYDDRSWEEVQDILEAVPDPIAPWVRESDPAWYNPILG